LALMRVVISGAGGFIGQRLLKRLAPTCEIWALSRTGGADADRIRWVTCDLAQGQLSPELPDSIDSVVHLAQSPHYRDFPASAQDIWDVSATAAQRLLDYALKAGAQNAVIASTGGLYGPSPTPIEEDHPTDADGGPLTFYFAAKRAAELVAQAYGSKLAVATLRFFFVYGSGQRDIMLMPRLVRSVREGRPLQLQGDDGISLNPIHVADAVSAVENAMGLEESAVVNVAGPQPVTLRWIGDEIGRLLGQSPRFEIQSDVTAGQFVADIARMRQLLYAPEVFPADGLAELVMGRPIASR
jgi:UDP-glucose 4-epimerase